MLPRPSDHPAAQRPYPAAAIDDRLTTGVPPHCASDT